MHAIARVKPGERVAFDGVVTKGNSTINQAPVTGESIPVDKEPGSLVFAGTINENGELEFRVTAAAANSTLARIIHAVEQAQGTRAPTQRLVDRFAAIYTPAVFAMALAVAVLPPLLLDWEWLTAIYKALVLLVIACPCALVISTPVSVVSGLAAAARRGILIKGGTYLENARLLKAVALDKTGTLTEGKPMLVASRAWGQADEAQVLRWAKSLAARSDHPVSKSIAMGLEGEAVDIDGFTALLGRGVEASVDGRTMVLGNHRLIRERNQSDAQLEAELLAHEAQGRTVTLLADANGVLGLFAVADTIKPSSVAAVAQLKRLGVTPVMLTGDNMATGQAFGHRRNACALRPDRDDGRRHQRRAGIGPGRHRLRHGWRRHRHGRGSRRHRDHERQPGPHRRNHSVEPQDARHPVAEHLPGTGHQGGLLRPRHFRRRDDVDGGVRGHGRQLAGSGQRLATAAPCLAPRAIVGADRAGHESVTLSSAAHLALFACFLIARCRDRIALVTMKPRMPA